MLMTYTGRMSEVLFREIDKLSGQLTDLRLFCMAAIISVTGRILLQEDLPQGMERTMAISNREMLKVSSLGWRRWLW